MYRFYDQDLTAAGYFHNLLILTFKVTFLLCDFYFKGHVFVCVVICMLCIQHSARPLRLPAARRVVDSSARLKSITALCHW